MTEVRTEDKQVKNDRISRSKGYKGVVILVFNRLTKSREESKQYQKGTRRKKVIQD